jgi:hypothetical protein
MVLFNKFRTLLIWSCLILTLLVLLFSAYNLAFAQSIASDSEPGIIPTQPLSSWDNFLNFFGAGIIPISGANQLDVNKNIVADLYPQLYKRDGIYASLKTGDYVRLTFERNLTKGNDITLYAKSDAGAKIEVYEKDSDKLITTFENISSDKKYQILFTDENLNQNIFDLKIIGNVEIDYAVDPTVVDLITDMTGYRTTDAYPYKVAAAKSINATHYPWTAFDKVYTTFWVGPLNTDNQWVQYDFGVGNAQKADSFLISNSYIYGSKNFTISGSDDGLTFTDLYSGAFATASSSVSANFASPDWYRFYRVTITSGFHNSSGNWYDTLSELNLYGYQTAPSIISFTALVPDMTGASTPSGTVTASAVYSTYYGWHAFNRDETTSWFAPLNTDNNWVQYDFGAGNEKFVTSMYLSEEYFTGSQGFTISASNDNLTFTNLYSGSFAGATEPVKQVEISNPNYYRYYRTTINTHWGNPTNWYDVLGEEQMYFSPLVPTVTLSSASSLTPTTATLNGNITFQGGENPTVTVYWGTTDGGQVTGNWQNSSAPTSPTEPQGIAAFLKNITGLTPGTTYYFSAKATNSAGTDWPPASLSFTTGAGVPTITLSAATGVSPTTGTLNGNVTATGGENPTVTMYWGTTDGGQVSGNWASSSAPTSPAQPQGVTSFLKTLTGLTPGLTYYFSAKATNSAGTSWPVASLNFITNTTGTPIFQIKGNFKIKGTMRVE